MAQRENESDLVGRLKGAGNPVAAFDEIIERYNERLYWHIRRIVVQHEEAEDVLQDTFVAAYTNIGGFRGESEGSLVGWLYKIATNLSIKALKRRKRGIYQIHIG